MGSERATRGASGADRFALRLALRLIALTATLCGFAALVTAGGLYAVSAIVLGAAAIQAALLVRDVHRTNRELARLVGAIRFDDFQQSFAMAHLGPSFAELEAAFEELLGKFRATRLEGENQRRYLEALVEHVPVAIVAVHDDGTVALLNSAARRLFDLSASTTVARLIDFGPLFQRDVAQSARGARIVTRMEVDGVQRQLVMSTTQLTVGGAVVKLITLQDIQRELDGTTLSTWHDMARILSHEILNSLTPIASLARTAEGLVAELPADGGELRDDLEAAVSTVARRADGLMRFVRSYRQFTQMPPPTLRAIELRAYLARVEQLLRAELTGKGVALHVTLPAAGLTVVADDALLDQAVINILHNAAHAAAGGAAPEVWLTAHQSERGRPVIEIADNGPGVDDALGDKIFLPFFTTKADGSGIGLALARQVMLVHQGAITTAARPGGGALFRLSF
ncbi:MAG: PAS domain-containing protein [Deltaproteobacteria bacterium]|nr:PAS domain-containing protein [Deltaproteobacteria bacterium]